MTSEQVAERAALWAGVERGILADLERVGAFDLVEYHATLEPLESLVMRGADPASAVHAVRRAIRDSAFRPRYSELADIVRDALGQEKPMLLPGADAAARRVVSIPKALPPHPDNPGRLAFREKAEQLRRDREANGDYPGLRVVSGGLESEAA
jgi:hypothetical protein